MLLLLLLLYRPSAWLECGSCPWLPSCLEPDSQHPLHARHRWGGWWRLGSQAVGRLGGQAVGRLGSWQSLAVGRLARTACSPSLVAAHRPLPPSSLLPCLPAPCSLPRTRLLLLQASCLPAACLPLPAAAACVRNPCTLCSTECFAAVLCWHCPSQAGPRQFQPRPQRKLAPTAWPSSSPTGSARCQNRTEQH